MTLPLASQFHNTVTVTSLEEAKSLYHSLIEVTYSANYKTLVCFPDSTVYFHDEINNNHGILEPGMGESEYNRVQDLFFPRQNPDAFAVRALSILGAIAMAAEAAEHMESADGKATILKMAEDISPDLREAIENDPEFHALFNS